MFVEPPELQGFSFKVLVNPENFEPGVLFINIFPKGGKNDRLEKLITVWATAELEAQRMHYIHDEVEWKTSENLQYFEFWIDIEADGPDALQELLMQLEQSNEVDVQQVVLGNISE